MKNLFIILCFISLVACHKDNPSTPNSPQHSSPPTSPDTSTIFLKMYDKSPYNSAYFYYDFDSIYPGWNGCTSCIPQSYFLASYTPFSTLDSVIGYVFNKGWKRLPYYNFYNNDGEWINNYPNDTITCFYIAPYGATSYQPIPYAGGFNFWYQTHYFNGERFPTDTIYLKIFIKPLNSNL